MALHILDIFECFGSSKTSTACSSAPRVLRNVDTVIMLLNRGRYWQQITCVSSSTWAASKFQTYSSVHRMTQTQRGAGLRQSRAPEAASTHAHAPHMLAFPANTERTTMSAIFSLNLLLTPPSRSTGSTALLRITCITDCAYACNHEGQQALQKRPSIVACTEANSLT